MFGLQLECLKNYREQNPLKEKRIRKRFDSFNNLSTLGQRLRVISVGQDMQQTFESSKSSALNINKNLEQASLIKTIFEANDTRYELSYNNKNSNEEEEAIVKVMDEHNIDRDSYRALAAIIHSLPREYVIEKRRNEINEIVAQKIPIFNFNTSIENSTSVNDHDTEEEIDESIIIAEESRGNGVRRNIKDILYYLIPYLIESKVLKDNDETLYIRISGDGRNVGRKIKHVMITFALLNDHENIFNPNFHYSLAIYTGQEDYECLKNVLGPLIQELNSLKENGFVDNFDKFWKVSLYISSDWKFLTTVLGFNAANSNYFCPWCTCNKSQQGNLNLNWSISKNMDDLSVNYNPKNPKQYNGQIRQPLFSMIPLDHWVIDELHLMLRVMDRLLSLLFNEIKITQSSNKNFSEALRKIVQEEMERIKVPFKFSLAENSKQWTYTSLMGPDKLKVLRLFNLNKVLSPSRADKIRELWDGFADLYSDMCDPIYNPLQFQNDALLWLKKFLTKSQGNPLQNNFIEGLYNASDITPYIHVLVYHVCEFMSLHQIFGLKSFSCSPVEKKNHMHINKFFNKTFKDGGNSNRKSAIYEIMESENRQIYYLINNIPSAIAKPTRITIKENN
jgi:hypothetical protein